MNINVSSIDINRCDYQNAIAQCKNYNENNFSDWRLPSIEEYKYLFNNKSKYPHIKNEQYWTNNEENNGVHVFNFSNGDTDVYRRIYTCRALFVRGLFEEVIKTIDDKTASNVQSESSINVSAINTITDIIPLTEEKFDKDIIPTTKTLGIIGSIVVGLGMIFAPNGGIIQGCIYTLVGIMTTLGLCILLEGFSTIIKLLRKISEK